MGRTSWTMSGSLALVCALTLVVGTARAGAGLSAAEVASKNATARGGLAAWRAVHTMTMSGKLTAGGNQRGTLPVPASVPGKGKEVRDIVPARPVEEVQLPFVMELERGRKMRFELQFNGQTALQVFDGSAGWKLRPFLNRRTVEPYTAEETKLSAEQADLDGPLMDYAAKGTRIELEGVGKVEDRDTYRLKLTTKTGAVLHLWIDAQTFLDTKIEGQPRRLDGVSHPVEIYFRDYRAVNGLQIPFLLETEVLPVAQAGAGAGASVQKNTPLAAEKSTIERVTINPKLDPSQFAKPQMELASNAR